MDAANLGPPRLPARGAKELSECIALRHTDDGRGQIGVLHRGESRLLHLQVAKLPALRTPKHAYLADRAIHGTAGDAVYRSGIHHA